MEFIKKGEKRNLIIFVSLAFLLCLFVIAFPVKGIIDYTGNLNTTIPSTPINGLSGASVAIVGTTTYTFPMFINYDTIAIPKNYIIYQMADAHAIGTTSFTIYDGLGIVATGGLSALNGTQVNPAGAKQYYLLTFNTWNPAARAGWLTCTLEIPNPSPLNIDAGLFSPFYYTNAGGASVSIGLDDGGGINMRNPDGGSLYIPDSYITNYDYTIETTAGIGADRISVVTYTKPLDNNLATNARVYNATSEALLFQSTKTDTITGESPSIVGSNYYLSMYIPLTGQIINTSAFYFNAIPVSAFTVTVNPTSLNYGNNFTVTSGGTFTNINEIKYGYSQGTLNNILDDRLNSDRIQDYSLIGGNWYQYNQTTGTFSDNVGASTPIGYVTANMGTGAFNIEGYFTSTTGEVYSATTTLTITGTALQKLTIDAIDYNDGQLAYGSSIHVLNIGSNVWDNRSVSAEQVFYYPYGQKIFVDVTATSYVEAKKNWTVSADDEYTLMMIMYRGVTTPATNVTIRVNVIDGTDKTYLYNAKVTVLNDDSLFDSESKYTNYGGIASFTVLAVTDYVISVSKDGYKSSGKLVASGVGGTTNDVDIIMTRGANPTTTPTVIPTTLPAGYIGGNLGGANITPATCQVTLPAGATLIDSLKNNMACMGITSGINQGAGIALGIIFVLGIIGGKFGKGMGVVMGMASGYIMSLFMGLVPLWTFVAMIIFICLILAIKLWAGDGK